MFGYISRKLNTASLRNKNESQNNITDKNPGKPIEANLTRNLEVIKESLCNCSDLTTHEFNFGPGKKFKGALIFIKSLVNKEEIHRNILKPLLYDSLLLESGNDIDYTDIDTVKANLLSMTDSLKITSINDIQDNILSGATILMVDRSKYALAVIARKWQSRNVEEPGTETVVRGPREGFIENINVNIALVRRKIKDPDLCIEELKIGYRSKTTVNIAYLKNVANPKLVNELRMRLNRIKTDAILESGYIEEFIEDAPYSVFPTVSNSEKPDKVAAKILEGRIAVFVDGTPFVLCVPMLFVESFQSVEDYYSRQFLVNIIRLIRYLSYAISILAPAIYVALTVFHQELIPTQLLISIASGRKLVPFSAITEAFIMILTFDILREAGIRLPKPVGQTVSIVGALVLGQSAVDAGLISPLMVIVVALTAIASFAVPAQTDSGTLLRYFFLILAGLAGGFGVIMGLLATLLHLSSLRSFGTPYLWPIAPLDFSGLKDTFIRVPIWNMKRRPKAITWNDIGSRREKPGLEPVPYEGDDNDSK